MSDFMQALSVQSRVIHAFLLRETRTRFGRSRLGYFWALFEPMAYILTMVAVFSALGRGAPAGMDITLFFFTAIIPWLLFLKMMTGLSGAIGANQQLLTYPQVKTLDVVVARIILEFSTLLIVAVLYLIGLSFFGIQITIDSVLLTLVGLLMATGLGIGMGLVGGVIRLYMPAWSNFQSILSRVLFFTSGKFFLAESLPITLQEWLWYNPVLHVVEWTRSAFFVGFESQFYDVRYLAFFILFLLFIGLAAERVSRYKLRQV